MPIYPRTIKEAQQKAAEIASGFGNFECVQCAKEIVKSLGPAVDAEVIKLRCTDDSELIQMPAGELLISRTGHHVGVRVGGVVFDNHHHGGIVVAVWPTEFVAATGAALTHYRRPIAEFFGRVFRVREFSKFCSNRPQK
jgi:hypothetical protein